MERECEDFAGILPEEGMGVEESERRFAGAHITNGEARRKWRRRYLGLGRVVVFLDFAFLFSSFLSNAIRLSHL